MSDKVKELAAKLVVGADKAWWGHEHLETVIRAELEPLLKAADAATEDRDPSCDCSICRLAAELQGWTARTPDGR